MFNPLTDELTAIHRAELEEAAVSYNQGQVLRNNRKRNPLAETLGKQLIALGKRLAYSEISQPPSVEPTLATEQPGC